MNFHFLKQICRAINDELVDTYQLKSLDGQTGKLKKVCSKYRLKSIFKSHASIFSSMFMFVRLSLSLSPIEISESADNIKIIRAKGRFFLVPANFEGKEVPKPEGKY